MFSKTIGILGGMGPVASADTYRELVEICQKKYNASEDRDFPHIIFYSVPLIDLTHKGFSGSETPQKRIKDRLVLELKKLQGAGAEIIMVDCTTVHHFFRDLQKTISVPLIDLIGITVEHIKRRNYWRIAVLCSATSRAVGLYTNPLEREGIEVLNTSEDEQKSVNKAILAVMSGSVSREHITKLNDIIERFLREGAQGIIIGCTEISHIGKDLNSKASYVDSRSLALEKILTLAKPA